MKAAVKKKRAHKIVFLAKHLGVPLDNLTREDYYEDESLNAKIEKELKKLNKK